MYEILVSEGPVSISQICRLSDLHRPTVYRALDRLKKSHLVKEIPLGKRVFFDAANPAVLQEILLEEENQK